MNMKLTVKYCTIYDVEDIGGGNSDRKVTLMMNEEDFFEMLDGVNPKNIIKYLDARNVNHREAPVINIYQCEKQRLSEHNRKKLDRCLSILNSMNKNEKL